MVLTSLKRLYPGPLSRMLQKKPPKHAGHSFEVSIDNPDPPEILALKSMATRYGLQRAVQRGLEVGTVVDVGASDGNWSEVCESHLPNARYILIEAQAVHETKLQHYCQQHPNADYVLAAAGDEVGEIYFDDSDPFGGQARREKSELATTRVPVTTIDVELQRRGLSGPYLIKLDTHGFEVPILEGAQRALACAELLIIETYNFRIAPNSLLFHEIIAYLAKKGFRVIDISEPLWRAKDKAFWQIDIFFQREDRVEFSYDQYA